MTRRTSRRRTSRRLRANVSTHDVERANLRLAEALKHIAPRIDKARLPNITMIAQSQAHKAATREGEMWGGGLNNTTYPRKHYALLESMVGQCTAAELRYFDDAYDAYMQWIYETSTPAEHERRAEIRLRRHEKRVPLSGPTRYEDASGRVWGPGLRRNAANADVNTFMHVFAGILTQEDQKEMARETKRGGRGNIYRLGHYLNGLSKIRDAVQVTGDSRRDATRILEAIDVGFTSGNPGDKLRKVVIAYLEDGKFPKYPVSKAVRLAKNSCRRRSRGRR